MKLATTIFAHDRGMFKPRLFDTRPYNLLPRLPAVLDNGAMEAETKSPLV
jgi:hypothetical protein